jgi:hypothetical protein
MTNESFKPLLEALDSVRHTSPDAHSAALAALTRALSPMLPTPEAPATSTPGFCYLRLFRDHLHADAAASLGKYPTRSLVERYSETAQDPFDPSRFHMSFGVPASVSRSQKFLCHIRRVPASESLLSARDVLQLAPHGAIYGDDTGSSSADRAAPLQLSAAPPGISPLLGSIPAPGRRRFLYCSKGLTYTDGVTAYVEQIDPAAGSNISTFLSFTQFAEYEFLAIHVVPCYVGARCMLEFDQVWYPEHEAAPGGQAEMAKRPTRVYHAIGPKYPGGVPDPLVIPCVHEYGVTRLIKPRPHFGGVPRIAIRYKLVPLTDEPPKAGDECYQVHVEAVIRTTPSGIN